MAFNIDVECGPDKNNRKQVHLFCNSLTNRWDFKIEAAAVVSFVKLLRTDKSVNVSILPRPPIPTDYNDIELCLSQLASTAEVLRNTKFQDFLQIPNEIRRGLKFVQHKPLGSPQRSTYLVRHSRNVPKNGETRWLVIATNDRGASVVCYRKQGDRYPVSSLKLAPSVQFQTLPEIPNSFLITSGKRQWILQAKNARDFSIWTSELKKRLDELSGHGHSRQIKQEDTSSKNVFNKFGDSLGSLGKQMLHPKFSQTKIEEEPKKVKVNIEQLKAQNRKLIKEIQENEKKIQEMDMKINELEEQKKTTDGKSQQIKEQMWENFRKEQLSMEDEHNKALEKIRVEIEKKFRKLEDKIRREGGDGIDDIFGEQEEKEEQKDENNNNNNNNNDDELDLGDISKEDQEIMKKMPTTQEESVHGKLQRYSVTFKNLHKHNFLHIMHHRHTHVHDETGEEDKVYTQTHTLAHTIVHTSTSFQKKRSLF